MKKKIVSLMTVMMILLGQLAIFAESSQLKGQDIGENASVVEKNGPIIKDVELVLVNQNGEQSEYTDGAEVNLGTSLKLTYKWAFDYEESGELEDIIKANDYFKFPVPDKLKIKGGYKNKQFFDEEGELLYEVQVKDGFVYFVFAKDASEEFLNEGHVQLEAMLDATKVPEGGPIDLSLPSKDQADYQLQLVPEGAREKPEKTVNYDRSDFDASPKKIVWDIILNEKYEVLENVKIEENIPKELQLQNIQVYERKDGAWKEMDQDAYSQDGHKLSFDTISTPTKIEVVTVVDESQLGLTASDLNLENTANLIWDNHLGYTVESSHQVQYDKLAEKRIEEGFDPVTHITKWEVDINKRRVQLDQPVFKDKLENENFEYIQESVEIFEKDTGKKIEDYSLEWHEDNSFTIKFKSDIHTEYQLKYQTKLKEHAILDNDTTVQNDFQYEHEGTFENLSSASETIGKGLIVKGYGYVNHNDRTISWRIDVNKHFEKLENLHVSDAWDLEGLQLQKDSMKVWEITAKGERKEINFEKMITYQEKGFKLSFPDGNSAYEITYVTDYDVRYFQSTNRVDIHNQAKMTYDFENTPNHSSDSSSASLEYFHAQSGYKNGFYHLEDRSITWEIYTNMNEYELQNAHFIDKIADDQRLISDSVEVWTYELTEDGYPTSKKQLDDAFVKEYIEVDVKKNQLQFTFPEGTKKRYLIVFKTSVIVDEDTTFIKPSYENKVQVDYGRPGEEYTYDGHVDLPHGEVPFLEKSGFKQDDDIIWTIDFNLSQSRLINAVIEDYHDDNQIVDLDSLTVHELDLSVDSYHRLEKTEGKQLEKGKDYTVSKQKTADGRDYFAIVFAKDQAIEKALRIRYQSEIFAEVDANSHHLTLTNKAVLKGFDHQEDNFEQDSSLSVAIDDLQASASGVKGTLKIVKKDSSTGELLQGAHFKLLTSTGRLVAEGETDENGEWNVERVLNRKYILEETQSPDGYIALSEPKEFKIEAHDLQNEEKTYVYEVENQPNSLSIHKINENQEGLKGAVFTLTDKEGNKKQYTSDDEGYLVIERLKDGFYTLEETKAPDGYIVDKTPIKVEVKEGVMHVDDKSSPKLTIEHVNFQGAIELFKTDFEGKPLEGVIFELFDEENQVIADELKTDEEGRIYVADLSPGNYYFLEKESTEGHLVSQEKIFFTIEKESHGQASLQTLNTQNFKAHIVFRKVNEQKEVLEGAEFKLTRLNDDLVISEKITSSGENIFYIENLAPGDYRLEELKAPDGYILNTEAFEFTIPTITHEEGAYVFDLGDIVNYQAHVQWQKINDDKLPLEGVRYALYHEGVYMKDLVSDADGHIVIEGLKPGSYEAKEIESADQYLIDPKPIRFTVSESYKGKPSPMILKDHINHKASIAIYKQNEAGEALAGVEFTLYDEFDQALTTATTDEKGYALFEAVGYGDYTIKETQTVQGYLLNKDKIDVSIAKEDTDRNHYEYTMVNYQGSVLLSKYDRLDEALEGVTFDLYQGKTKIKEDLQTDEQGQIFLENLEPNDYFFVETASVDGRLIDPRPIPFTIVKEAKGKPDTVQVTAYANDYASATLHKVNVEGDKIDAVFTLEKEEANDWISYREKLHTENGRLHMEALHPGNYRLREIQSDEEYLINTETVFFTIPESFEGLYHLDLDDFVNHQGSILIEKVDEQDHSLKGAEFILENIQTGEKHFATVDGHQHRFDGLRPGSYRLHETITPQGYQPLEKSLEIDMVDRYEGAYEVKVKVSNTRMEVVSAGLPETGETPWVLYISLLMFVLGVLIFMQSYRSKR